jgi:hypothetical protein
METELFHVDGQADMTKITLAFRNFVKTQKKKWRIYSDEIQNPQHYSSPNILLLLLLLLLPPPPPPPPPQPLLVLLILISKIHPTKGHEGPKGEERHSSTLSSTSSLHGGGWLTSRLVRFTPRRETRYPFCRRFCGFQGRFGQMQNISPPPGFDFKTNTNTTKPWMKNFRTPAIQLRVFWNIDFKILFWTTSKYGNCKVLFLNAATAQSRISYGCSNRYLCSCGKDGRTDGRTATKSCTTPTATETDIFLSNSRLSQNLPKSCADTRMKLHVC